MCVCVCVCVFKNLAEEENTLDGKRVLLLKCNLRPVVLPKHWKSDWASLHHWFCGLVHSTSQTKWIKRGSWIALKIPQEHRVLKALSFFTFVRYWWIRCAWGWGGVQDAWHEGRFFLPVASDSAVVEKWDANTHSLMKHTSFPFYFLFSNLIMGWDLGSCKQAKNEKISL